MVNGNPSLPTTAVQQPTGLISKMLSWVMHPTFADSDPKDWAAFVVLFVMLGWAWSKVVKQTLDAAI
jgi:hypothetical protein